MVNPVGVFSGAGGGLLFSAIYDVLKELTIMYLLFKHVLKSVKSTLESLEEVTQKIVKLNAELDRPETELATLVKQLKDGKVLVDKCKKIRPWRVDRKYKYSRKLLDWNDALKEQYDLLSVYGVADGKETLVKVNEIGDRVNQVQSKLENIEKKLDATSVEAGLINQTAMIEAWGAVPDLPPLTVGLDGPLSELKKIMFNVKVSMVVLTAPGGCGKTTLAKKFCRDKEVEENFKDNIIFLTVSKTPNFCLIVQDVYRGKGQHQVPPFENEEKAETWLQTFVREQGHPLLIVLDDVWEGSDSLLEKFALKNPYLKVLVTSRSKFLKFGSPYELEPLDFQNAELLFNHEASMGDKSSGIPQDISRQVIKGCKGFPLAITVTGRSLCGKPVEVWQKRLVEWSKGSSILDFETELLLRLQTSLDDIMVKKCFLDLGSFPEDKRIPVDALIDIWTESYESLDDEILCVANLHQITNRSLADLVVTRKDKLQGDGYYTEHFLTQHDLLRDLAIFESKLGDTEQRERLIINISGDNFPKWWREQKHQCMKARLLSISTDEEFSANWPDMVLPEAEVLVLNFQTKNYALPPFVDKMVKVKVLVLTNYGTLPSEVTNFQLLCTSSKLKRMRLERISIPSMSNHAIQFSSLQKLSLFMCSIGQAFSNNGSIQLSHAWPNLVELNIDYCTDLVTLPSDTSNLIHLKKLSITNNHKLLALPEDIGKLDKLELLRLRSCSSLEKLPASTGDFKKLNFLDISSCFSIKKLPKNIGELRSLKKLIMRDCSRLRKLPRSVSNLTHLKVIGDDDTQGLWQPFLPIEGTHIELVKENINLKWLHKDRI